jgi:hypothetical protein
MITKILKEELFRIQDLMNIKRTILNEEKAATSTVEGKCLNLKDYSKEFSAAQAATNDRAQEFINGILEYVKTTTPDLYSKWQSGTFLGISKVTLIGCASNRVRSDRNNKYVQYSSMGGRAVLPTMDNNYVVKTYDKTSYNTVLSGAGINDLNYPEYQVFFDDDLKYAADRANNLWKAMKPLLAKNKIVFIDTPTIESHIVDTGGRIDENRDTASYPNPGQIVLFKGTICEYKGERSPDLACIKGLTVEFNYDEVVESTPGAAHCCNRGRFNLTLNGEPIVRNDGKLYASVNNASAGQENDNTGNDFYLTVKDAKGNSVKDKNAPGKIGTMDIQVLPDKEQLTSLKWNRTHECCETTKNADKINKSKDRNTACFPAGNYRYNVFTIDDEKAKAIYDKAVANNDKFLTLKSTSDHSKPHKESVRVLVKNANGEPVYDVVGNPFGPFQIPFCAKPTTTVA